MTYEAGRELDALIAERVMDTPIYWADTGGVEREPLRKESTSPADDRSVPEYSTDIAAAWIVVEAMQARGYGVRVVTWPDATEAGIIKQNGPEDFTIIASKQAPTAPLAICLAALAALEAQ